MDWTHMGLALRALKPDSYKNRCGEVKMSSWRTA